MKPFVVGTLLLSLLSPLAIADSANKSYSIELSKPNEPMVLAVEMFNGSITVEGYNGKTVEISAAFSDLSGDELSQVQKEQGRRHHGNESDTRRKRSIKGLKPIKNSMMQLEIEESDNEVEISSDQSTKRIDLIVKVPKSAMVGVELYRGGNITINNITGPLELESWKGNIIANNIQGPIVAETHQTDIVATFAQLNPKHPSSLVTHSGHIDISLASKIAARINVQSYQGEIYSGLTEAFKSTVEVKQNKKGKRQQIRVGGQMSADVNGGGQSISLTTYSGDIYIRKQ